MQASVLSPPGLQAQRLGLPRPSVTISVLVLAFWAVVALVGPLFLLHGPNAFVTENGFAPPRPDLWLGSDYLGRDLLSRLVVATRVTLMMSLLATIIAHVLGDTLGTFAALRGGIVDALLCQLSEIMLSLPKLIVGLVVVAILGPSEALLIFLTGIIYAATVFRVSRSLALDVVTLDYVRTAQVRGEGWVWLVFGEVLPNLALPLAADFAMRLSFCILFMSNMSFLGLGLQPPAADWGALVHDNMDGLTSGSFAALYPALAIASVSVALNVLVDAWGKRHGSGESAR